MRDSKIDQDDLALDLHKLITITKFYLSVSLVEASHEFVPWLDGKISSQQMAFMTLGNYSKLPSSCFSSELPPNMMLPEKIAIQSEW